MKKFRITKEESFKIKRSKVRDMMKDDGYFDGRFFERKEKSKKAYSRNEKNKTKRNW
jgi:hypothetical protein